MLRARNSRGTDYLAACEPQPFLRLPGTRANSSSWLCRDALLTGWSGRDAMSQATANRYRDLLAAMYRRAIRLGHLTTDHVKGVENSTRPVVWSICLRLARTGRPSRKTRSGRQRLPGDPLERVFCDRPKARRQVFPQGGGAGQGSAPRVREGCQPTLRANRRGGDEPPRFISTHFGVSRCRRLTISRSVS